MADRIVPPSAILQIIESDGNMSQEFQAWTQLVTNLLTIVGSGSPEGVIVATQGAQYMDADAETGDILYVKRLPDIDGDASFGWRAV